MIEIMTIDVENEFNAVYKVRSYTGGVYSLNFIVFPISRKKEVAAINRGIFKIDVNNLGVEVFETYLQAYLKFKESKGEENVY